MNDREKWRERVRDILASGTTWWWWCRVSVYVYICIYIYIYTHTHTKCFKKLLRLKLYLSRQKWMMNDWIFILRNCSIFWKSLVEVESTNWEVVKLFNTQNKLMDVHQSDISKILLFSTSNLVSFIFIKSRHFTEAYLVLLYKTSHTSYVLFLVWFPCTGSRESTPISSR